MVMNQRLFKQSLSIVMAVFLSLSLVFPATVLAELQDVVDSKDNENIFIYIGDLVTVKVHSLTRIAVGNPSIVDVTNATADEIVLIGRKVGDTPIFIWDEFGKRRIIARVLGDDLGLITQRIAALVDAAGIKGVTYEKNYYEGKVVLSGFLTKDNKKKLDDTIKEFSANVINMVKVEGELIEIDVQISELSKTLTQALGLDWTSAIDYAETLPAATGKFKDLFKIGDFNRSTVIEATVNALITEGKGRVLSKPSIVVTNGEQASFNVGGEIPIRTTTSSAGGVTQENITFKNYGIDLNVTPEIKEGKIDIKMDVQIRDIDSANAVGDNVAFTTRKASTMLRVSDGQLIVLAGLLKRNKSETSARVPFLSKIPVVGLLFRKFSNPVANTDLELVISLRPHIYGKKGNEEKDGIKPSKELAQDLTTEEVLSAMDDLKNPNQKNKKKTTAPKVNVPKTSVTKATEKADKNKSETKKEVKEVKKDIKKNEKKNKTKQTKAAETKAKQPEVVRKPEPKAVESKPEPVVATEVKTPEKAVAPVVPPAKPKESTTAALQFSAKAETKANDSLKFKDDDVISFEETKAVEPQNSLSDSEVKQLKDRYTDQIKKEMAEMISYPYEAKENGWEGTVMLNMTILPDGNVKDVSIEKTSGRAIFDNDAMNTAKILAPYDSFQPAKNLREVKVSIPVDYTEKAMFGAGAAAPAKP